MTITWRGLGFLGFMIPLALWALALILFGHASIRAARIAFLISAAATWVIGSRLNGDETDDEGKPPHLAFGLPMQKAGVLLSAAAFVLTLL